MSRSDTPRKQTAIATVREDLLLRARGEYLEMPGLRLTPRQAQRLWGLDAQSCADLLDALTAACFLYRRDDGTYARVSGQNIAKIRRRR